MPVRLPAIRRLAAIGLLALCGCQPAPPVRVGFIGGLSGRVSDLAVDARNGALLAVEDLNAHGPQRYELDVHDDGHSVAGGIAAVDAAASAGDAFAVGPMTSVLALGMLAQAERRQVVLISPTANADALAGRDDWFFRVIAPARPGAEQLAQAVHERGARRVAAVMEWHNRTYSENFAAAFARRFEALGGEPVALAHFDTESDPDYAGVAAQALASHPSLVLLVCGAVDAAIIAQQVRRLDPHVRLAVASWAANVQLVQLGGRAVEGALVQQVLDLDSRSPAYLDFVDRYRKRFGTVAGQAAVYGYQAVQLGAEALRRGHGERPLRDVLREPGSWPGLQAPVVLDRYGDSASGFHLSEIRGGRFVMLPP